MAVRIEHDLVGDKEVPVDAYYGVHTVRAMENFAITKSTIAQFPELIAALAAVKQAAAQANRDLGLLPPDIAAAVIGACEEIRAGRLTDQFVVDPVQGGAGTSTNMNANEVIANRALEILGHPRGRYDVIHPSTTSTSARAPTTSIPPPSVWPWSPHCADSTAPYGCWQRRSAKGRRSSPTC